MTTGTGGMLPPAWAAGEAAPVKSSDGSVAMRTNIPVRGLGGSLFQAKGGHCGRASDYEAMALGLTRFEVLALTHSSQDSQLAFGL